VTAPAESPGATAGGTTAGDGEANDSAGDAAEATGDAVRKRRRRGSRGGRKRSKPRAEGTAEDNGAAPDELPDPPGEGRPSVEAAEKALVRKAAPPGAPVKPKIGDTMPAPAAASANGAADSGGGRDSGGNGGGSGSGGGRSRRRRGGRGGGDAERDAAAATTSTRSGGRAEGDGDGDDGDVSTSAKRRRRRRKGKGGQSGPGSQQGGGQQGGRRTPTKPVEMLAGVPIEIDDETLERRRGRERKGRPVGRYLMCVHVSEKATQIAVLEGRALIEHYVSHPSDDISQIHGNIYLGKVQNVLPGMEAAFVDIGTPKNAVLYRGDVQYDREDVDGGGPDTRNLRIEQMLRAGQTILCQVTKNPIGAKGARLTQEVSLPGRFVVLIPNSSTYGISKRLPDDERKRLRQVLDRVKPAQHGIIVRTAAEGVTSDEIENDVRRLLRQWEQIDKLAKRSKAPAMLYREPDMAVRVIREEFNQHYRGVIIDDAQLYEQVRDYVGSISPTLADRVEYFDPSKEQLPLFERHHVHEQLHRALDPKVWLPSGGSLIIEKTEALTVIDVNTGKNVGKSSLEETVFKNNLEAAVEIARQLRLRDIGGIIVVDFIDMERRDNRDEVVQVFRDALSRDKTRTQVFDISELGLCEMTRKRIGEGLLESFSTHCPMCEGRGVLVDKELLPD
jgi:ribonuclease E